MKPASASEGRVEIQMSGPGTFPDYTSEPLKIVHKHQLKLVQPTCRWLKVYKTNFKQSRIIKVVSNNTVGNLILYKMV